MRASHWVFLLRATCLFALGTSVALLLDYTRPDPSFCGLDSGCGAVRHSGLGYIRVGVFALPVPALGVLGFALLFASTLQRSARMRAAVSAPLAYVAALLALGFIALQAALGHFCYLCMIVDSCGILAGVCALRLRGAGWEEAASEAPFHLRWGAWVLLSLLAVLAPTAYPWLVRTSDVPGVIRALYASEHVTVLEFFDFQCPHCQHLSPRLKALVEEDPRLKLRFGYTPLPNNPGSKDAARATICAGEQGKEEEVAMALFASRRFGQEHVRQVAEEIVPHGNKLAQCLQSERPDQRILADTTALQTAGFEGLPTTYVGGIRVLGAQEDLVYRDAFRRVLLGSDTSGLSPWAYWAGVLLLLLVILLQGSVKKSAPKSSKKSARLSHLP